MMKRFLLSVAALAFLCCTAADVRGASDPPGYYRNGYMLVGNMANKDYDWWWHSLVAENKDTGELRPFFIEYYVVNPGLGGTEPILGQLPENKAQGVKPSYAMIKAGTWGDSSSAQIHNFYGIDTFSAATATMDVVIGSNTATDTSLVGSVKVTPEEAAAHPEYMCDAGEMSWDLTADKLLSYSMGYGTSELFSRLNAFQMFWHVQGMFTQYSGTIIYNGQEYIVRPETSAGYQDKNWGSDYTNPWIWLNCNNFKSADTGKKLKYTSLDVGGGNPTVFGVPLGEKVIIAFYYQGDLYEFNFSKFWTNTHLDVDCGVRPDEVYWNIAAWTSDAAIEINFTCPKSHMQLFNYENPQGEKNHDQLWNGGFASGTVKFYKKRGAGYILIDTLEGRLGGCEYGRY